MHQPALVNALLTDNHGDGGGSLRGDVKAACVVGQIAVEIPANPNVTKFKGSSNSATHFEGTVGLPMDSAVSDLPLTSPQSSIRAARLPLHARRPPNAAARKFCLWQVL
jgi:hypothetical protein